MEGRQFNMIVSSGANDKELLKETKVSVAVNTTGLWNDFVQKVIDFDEWLVLESIAEKVQIPMWIPGEVHVSGGRKTNDNIKYRNGFALDYDDGEYSFTDLIAKFSEYEFVLYSSPNYGIKQGYRCRLFFPLTKDMTPDEWAKYRSTFKHAFSEFDGSAFTLSQGQNAPAYVRGTEPFYHHNIGKHFDIAELEYVEDRTAEPCQFERVEVDDDELNRVFDAVVMHCSGRLSRTQAWFFAQVMKSYGIYDYHRVSAVQRPNANTNPLEFFKNTSSNPCNIWMLKKYLPEDFVFIARKEHVFQQVSEYLEEQNATDDVQYDQEFFLEDDQYLSDIASEMNFDGSVLLIGGCGLGKTRYWSEQVANGLAVMIVPLLIIAAQNAADKQDFNNIQKGMGTYQQIHKISDEDAAKMTLIIDEAHGLYLDGFKDETNRLVHEQLSRFKNVVFTSGTIRAEYFSNIQFDRVIRIHKKQKFKKVLTQVRTVAENDLYEVALQKIVSSGDDKKCIILLNNIDKITAMQNKLADFWPDYRLLRITAKKEDKENPDYICFIENQVLGCYNGLIGTNSLVEGININDETEECDVHIIGEISPERIEQVTNRWRRCNGRINVFHYTYDVSSLAHDEQYTDVKELVGAAEAVRDAMNRMYGLYDAKTKSEKLNTYRNEMAFDNIYWDFSTQRFEVSNTKIDNTLAEMRTSRSITDYAYYKQTLGQYGFMFKSPIVQFSRIDLSRYLEQVKTRKESLRVLALDLIKEQFDPETAIWTTTFDTPEAETQREFIRGFMHKGLRAVDVPEYIERLKKDEKHWQRLSEDLRDAKYGNAVANAIKAELPRFLTRHKGKQGLTPNNCVALAQLIIDLVREEYFRGDAGRMSQGMWSGLVEFDGSMNKASRASRRILDQYLMLGNTTKPRIDGVQTRFIEVLADTRTGFIWDTEPSIINIKNSSVSQNQGQDQQRMIEAS